MRPPFVRIKMCGPEQQISFAFCNFGSKRQKKSYNNFHIIDSFSQSESLF